MGVVACDLPDDFREIVVEYWVNDDVGKPVQCIVFTKEDNL